MFKEDIIKTIEEIDEQLKKNKEVIDVCEANADVSTLCELSKLLVKTREMWQNMLLDCYGIYYMREL